MEVGDFFFFFCTNMFFETHCGLNPCPIAFSLGQLSDDLPIFLSVERYTNETELEKKKEGKSKRIFNRMQSQNNVWIRRERERILRGGGKIHLLREWIIGSILWLKIIFLEPKITMKLGKVGVGTG